MQRITLAFLVGLSLLSSCKSSKTTVNQPEPASAEPAFPFMGQAQPAVDELYIDACTYLIRGDLPSAAGLFQTILMQQPGHHAAAYNLARIRLEERAYPSALDLVQRALNGDPRNRWYRRLQVDILERQGSLRQAVEAQQALARLAPAERSDLTRLAELQHRLGQPDLALATLLEAEKQFGQTTQGQLLRYQWLMELRRPAEAVTVARYLLAVEPSNARYQQLLYQALAQTGNPAAAIQALKDWLAASPKEPQAQTLLYQALAQNNQTDEARQVLEAAFENPALDIAWKIRHLEERLLANPNQIVEVEQLLVALRRAHPEAAEANALEARMRLQPGVQPDSARSYLLAALKGNEASLDTWKQLLGFSFSQGRYDHLYQDSQEAREYFPNQEEVLFYYAISAASQGQTSRALRTLERIELIQPEDKTLLARTQAEHARLLAQRGEADEASRLIGSSVQLSGADPFVQGRRALVSIALEGTVSNESLRQARQFRDAAKGPDGQALMGFVLWKKGDLSEAVNTLEKATAQAEVAEWLLHLGRARLQAGDRTGAEEALRRAKEAGADILVEDELTAP